MPIDTNVPSNSLPPAARRPAPPSHSAGAYCDGTSNRGASMSTVTLSTVRPAVCSSSVFIPDRVSSLTDVFRVSPFS